MRITLNNQELNITNSKTNLLEILQENNLYVDRGIAVAINDEILPKSEWKECLVQDNDNILIITATQGG